MRSLRDAVRRDSMSSYFVQASAIDSVLAGGSIETLRRCYRDETSWSDETRLSRLRRAQASAASRIHWRGVTVRCSMKRIPHAISKRMHDGGHEKVARASIAQREWSANDDVHRNDNEDGAEIEFPEMDR
jgi:hypothetical protein